MASSEIKKSPQLSKMRFKVTHTHTTIQTSDSDASVETNSLSAESSTELVKNERNPANRREKRKKKNRRGSEWEIMEGLKDGQRFDNKPNTFSGYLHKKRKWPLKGWHKRYFVVEKGILVYGKSPTDINKGKIHGSLDIGLSVITTKPSRRRVDIDAEEFIYHLKAKTDEIFSKWVQQLSEHRLYRQHILTYGSNMGSLFDNIEGVSNIPKRPAIRSPEGTLTRGGMKNLSKNTGRLDFFLKDSLSTLEKFQRNTAEVEQNLVKMTEILQQIETLGCNSETANEVASPSLKKDRRKFGLKKKKSAKSESVDLSVQFNKKSATGTDADNISPLSANSLPGLSTSPNISNLTASTAVPTQSSNILVSDSGFNLDAISLSTDNQCREDFLVLAKLVLNSLKSLSYEINTERERLKTALESEPESVFNRVNPNTSSNSLSQILQQNMDLKNRLLKIHEASNLGGEITGLDSLTEKRATYNHSLSYSSSCVSVAEFFDAEELPPGKTANFPAEEYGEKDEESEVRTRSDSSSEAGSLSSGEDSLSSESELGTALLNTEKNLDLGEITDRDLTGRRTTLPVPRPHTEGLSLWNLLSKNIGKDLSQISMPVALNEPLNVLQRLCEELEYSELLDKAAGIDDPYERMVQIAAFAVSGYASTLTRAGNKPFNPLLGETYECIREDKGFRFISEQVSHHPPISACYAESSSFTFWQDARVKTKFWGKSMEFQPLGKVHVLLPKTGDLYVWNKVTTCVHNLFSNQRWVDQYGELKIDNGKISCKLTFSKASYWSSKRHEVVGAVYDEYKNPVRRLFGKWSESLYCGVAPSARCVWRAGNLPANHEHYYGFTRFAIELNELGPDPSILPPTDTRFRPDQRALENGDINAAENLKLQLENAQRDRRRRREELNLVYEPKWFSNPRGDMWEYNGKYWEIRKCPGFSNLQFESLW